MSLHIQNLNVDIEGKEIVKNVSFELQQNEIIALMGPNGCGKSTLANALMGNPKYKIKSGTLFLDGKDLTTLAPDKRCHEGLFMTFQHPCEVSGVSIANFLRLSLAAKLGKPLPVLEFKKILEKKMDELSIDRKFLVRSLNEGFSGGEKKKAELLQLAILEPRYAILDEIDSGCDVDALKVIGESIKKMKTNTSFIVITHYNRILHYLMPDRVLIMADGKIVQTGDAALAKEIEQTGYGGRI